MGECYDMYLEDIRNQDPLGDLEEVIAELAAESESKNKFIEAVGLATTFKPTMQIDPDHPVEMMLEVEEYLRTKEHNNV